MRTYTITLPYPPTSGNHHVKHGAGRHYLTAQAREYRAAVGQACAMQGVAGLKLAGPLLVAYSVIPPDDKARDDDNLLKPAKDALTKAGVWVDDSNKVIRSSSLDWYEPEKPGRIVITITAP